MDGGEVILFPKAPDDSVVPPTETRKTPWDGCQHRRTVLDLDAHQMVCRDCSQALDLFDWALKFTREWARWNTEYRQARQQAVEATKRLKTLERAERNAKARIRKQGVNLSTAEARAALDQIRALSSALANVVGDREQARRRAALCGFKEEDARRAVAALSAQLDLEKVAGAEEETA